VLISGIFRKEQVFFKWYGTFYKRILKYISQYFVQNKESVQLLQSINIQNIELAGDTRIDRVVDIAQNTDKFPEIENFLGSHDSIFIGSAWQDDLDVIVPLMNDPDVIFKFVIVPHEINQTMIQALSERINERVVRYSDCLSGKAGDFENAHVLIIDSVGILSQIYQYGSFAYIGGAFGDGLHNILEPAVFGLPVFFGNKYYNKFHEANDLIALGGAYPVSKSSEFKSKLLYLSEDKERMKGTSSLVKNYIYDNAGATQKVVNYFEKVGLK
jgi:3-deoxy-D-manno-octulosonic-acid transferase